MIYPEALIDSVKDATSIIALIGERSEVKQAGRKHVCCCPFHSEKTPSFHINEEEGLYYCFGCGKKGNTFTFVMETRGLTFPESVRYLASKAGISLPAQSPRVEQNLQRKNHLKKILSEAQNFYEDSFWKNKNLAKDFLNKRNISEDVAKRFHVGLAIKRGQGQLLDYLISTVGKDYGISKKDIEEGLLEVGLLRQRDSGKLSELFWDRILFPITRSDHSPIAFGGRALTDSPDNPKYINSPESSMFIKRKSFYGMGPGFLACQKQKEVYIVEGYTDVIALSQIGIENVLAVCGTALTEEHAKILSRIVKRVFLVFDGDKAGRMALSRSFQSFLNSGLEVIPIFLPEGEDPDSLRMGRDDKQVIEIFKQGQGDLLKLYIGILAAEVRGLERGSILDLSDVKASEAGLIADKICKILSEVRNPVEREVLLKHSGSMLGVAYDTLNSMLAPLSTSIPKIVRSTPPKEFKEFFDSNLNIEEFTSASDKSLSMLKRQLMIACLVDPNIIKVESIFENLKIDVQDDAKITLFLDRITRAFRPHDPTLMQTLQDPELREEVIAKIYGILIELGLEKDGLLEEAFSQLSTGGAEYGKLISSFTQALGRLSLLKDIDGIKSAELRDSAPKDKILMAQEKLEKKRALSKNNS